MSARRIVIAVAIGVAIISVWIALSSGTLDVDGVVGWLEQVGGRWWAPLAFIALYTVFNLVLAPATALTLSAGVIWGWLLGGVWVLVASTVGSAFPYLIGRSGSRRVEQILRRRAERLNRMLES
ncbi:MAG: TVP38/TMEM64 family protein, partial [Thermoanaerobaculia bacterium]